MADQAQVSDLIEKMTAERARLLAVLEALSEAEAERPPSPGEWNQKQQMSHLAEMETAYRAWVEKAVAEDGADVDGVRGERPAIPLEKANEHSVAEHVAELRRQRGRTMALIAGLGPEDFDRRARNQIFGELTVLQWLRSYYRHDRMHYDQVRGEEPTYKPRFQSGAEPDQRRGASA
ncbi:MAG: DinB family protein [Dehalococcoidia bacterium]|nr:DinB family protein [Dehalococcoidia bacterium]